MKVNELSKLINAKNLHDIGLENEVKSGYTCDLLSWVMARERGLCLGYGSNAHECSCGCKS